VKTILPVMSLLLSALSLCAQSVPDRIYQKMLAPCCWHESLAVHRSETALALRDEIAGMAKAGMSEDAITKQVIQRYGVRILREPPGQRAKWLYALPVIAAILGALLLVRFVKRNLKKDEPLPVVIAG
jgi:cytochrome c-type biogenesis protein CcmH